MISLTLEQTLSALQMPFPHCNLPHLQSDGSLLTHHLTKKSLFFEGVCTDSRRLTAGQLFVALKGGQFDGHQFVSDVARRGAIAAIVQHPLEEVPNLPLLQVSNSLIALGQLGHYWRMQQPLQKLVALTGSNGKTTTKEMIAAILAQRGATLATEGNLNNEIGVPLTLFNLHAGHQFAVVEMGASRLQDILYLTQLAEPTVAIVTQCATAHLAGFGSLDNVALTKGEIFYGLQAQGTAIINADDMYAEQWQAMVADYNEKDGKQRRIVRFGLTQAAEVTASAIQTTATGSEFVLHTELGSVTVQLPLLGRHNVMNALAATAAALACGCSLDNVQQGLYSLHSVKGRLQRKQGLLGCTVIDDTYNANPASLLAALQTIASTSSTCWLVLGDMNELGEDSALFHAQAGEQAHSLGFERLWTLGNMSPYALETFGSQGQHFKAVEALIENLRSEIKNVQGQVTILVKGSRGMQMERVVKGIEAV